MDIKANNNPSGAEKVVERNINALLERKIEQLNNRSAQHKLVDAITSFAGSMLSVYIHLFVYLTWIICNIGYLPFKPFDPSFIILATFAAVEAIFLSTFILMSQNLMSEEANKRAELDLQISLLTEHEVTRIMTMLTAIATKMGLENIVDEEIQELTKDIHPENVMDTMESVIAKKSEC
jgi:uncharacterized membrane protein